MSEFPPRPLLVPVDYSAASLNAVRVARTMAADEDILVVYVGLDFDLIVPAHGWAAADPETTQESQLKRLQQWRDENALGEVRLRVEFGDPGMEVCRVAEETETRLIIVSSHGRHGLKRILLGSVAERIIRHCHCSVLVLRRRDKAADEQQHAETQAWLPRTNVLVPIDFSESSVPAIATARQLVHDDSHIDVLNVIYELDNPVLIGTDVITDDIRRAGRQEYLETWLAEQGYPGVRAHVVVGDPGIMIVDYAKKSGCDTIVMPSHGYHGMKRIVLGSTTERVIRYAEQPVLVLRRHDAD